MGVVTFLGREKLCGREWKAGKGLMGYRLCARYPDLCYLS